LPLVAGRLNDVLGQQRIITEGPGPDAALISATGGHH
jgi:hypothetical protein